MTTLEERVAHIEKFLNDRTGFEPIPDPRYVKVILDETVSREPTYLKPYTYEDRTMQGLKVGDRVVVPVGAYGSTKDATVIATGVRPVGNMTIRVVAGVL